MTLGNALSVIYKASADAAHHYALHFEVRLMVDGVAVYFDGERAQSFVSRSLLVDFCPDKARRWISNAAFRVAKGRGL